jgi:predicted nucleotidyltransferase component of viral defense system
VKDHLLAQLEGVDVLSRENIAREYLQVFLLRLLHQRGANAHLAFVGGTALRLLHRLPRFSEDLDFSRIDGVPGRFDPNASFRSVRRDLEDAGYRVSARAKSPGNVTQAWFRFEGLPAEAGWSRDPRVGLSIRVEADLRPPEGAGLETTLIQRFYPIALRHHDLPSLFAGKLHALLARPWPKGRDWYDLVWYLTEQRGLEPHLDFLGAALAQTGHHALRPSRWRSEVLARLRALDWSKVIDDVRPFLERPSDLDSLTPAAIEKLLRGSTGP